MYDFLARAPHVGWVGDACACLYKYFISFSYKNSTLFYSPQ